MFMSKQDAVAMQNLPTSFGEMENMEDQQRWAQDKKLFVQFYKRAIYSTVKSADAGRPIYDEIDYVKIVMPGDRTGNVDTEATMEYRHRFSDKWQKYVANQQESVSGTPLETWPVMTVGTVAELKALGIYTVEQLAALSDQQGMNIQGFNRLRLRAQAFLDAAEGDAQNSKMMAELEKRDADILALKTQLEELMADKVAASPKATKG